MLSISPSKSIAKLFVVFVIICSSVQAQVGVGTTTPNGALDISNSTMGLVPPRVALTSINTAAPVVNPQGGALLAGTMVYNTNDTMPGTYAVSPGLYFWNGSQWVSQYQRKYYIEQEQSSILTTHTTATQLNIPGLVGHSFVAPYDGTYQFIFTGNLGAQQVDAKDTNISGSEDIDGYGAVGFVEGLFRLSVNGTNYDKYNYSTSHYRSSTGSNGSGGTDIYLLFNEITIIVNVTLSAGDTCPYSATYGPIGDENIVTTGNNQHQVGETDPSYENLCRINVTYLGRG